MYTPRRRGISYTYNPLDGLPSAIAEGKQPSGVITFILRVYPIHIHRRPIASCLGVVYPAYTTFDQSVE